MDTKVCTTCEQEKPLSDFYMLTHPGTRKKYPSGACRKCINKNNRTKKTSVMQRLKGQGVEFSLEEFHAMYDAQEGKCAICKEELGEIAQIDHCHVNLFVRGLLCSGCNKGLGFFKDDIVRLEAAIEYLKSH